VRVLALVALLLGVGRVLTGCWPRAAAGWPLTGCWPAAGWPLTPLLMARILGLSVALLLCTPLMLTLIPLQQIFDSSVAFDHRQVRGSRVLICGASSGIGEQLAFRYAELGAHVALVARREELLEGVAAEARRRGAASAVAVAANLGTQSGMVLAVQSILATPAFGGQLDVLVLNHAVQRWGWLLPPVNGSQWGDELGSVAEPWSMDFMDTALKVNFASFVQLSVLAMPALVRGAGRSAAVTSRIVVVSSGAGKLPAVKQSVYAGAKHALHGFFDSLRLELEHKGLPITITTAVLGLVETETAVRLTSGDLGKMPMASAAQAAGAILRAGHSGREELYWPPEQFLHIASALRAWPGLRWGLDRLNLAVSGGASDGSGFTSSSAEGRMKTDDVDTSGADAGAPQPSVQASWNRSILTAIYLCHACSCQEKLRVVWTQPPPS
jgi:corticosteroid 11-beta-dehydrogenase isozyme 1